MLHSLPCLRISTALITDRRVLFGVMGAILLVLLLFFGTAMLIKKSKRKHLREASGAEALPVSASPTLSDEQTNRLPSLFQLVSPLSGKVVLSGERTSDSLPSKAGGYECFISPSEGKVYAPCDCTVRSVGEDYRSLVLEFVDAELVIQIGTETALSSEQNFIPCCKAGDSVKEGDLLLSFDMDALDKADFDPIASIRVINGDSFAEIKLTDRRKVSVGDHLMTLLPKNSSESIGV